ncbi:DUF29 family protein [Argonema galeatum]|uniref:DUF29 family protein n=1 Tax=Argonema galeatum TaxID=2942762 RepID=UPI002010C7B7|nr:DUF29 family protein [Argonema galeatum]MCL1464962.1 DUF29 domain-containing protein [Argonema galeatum A003/A1]
MTTQELTNLRASILEGRYTDALIIVDELEGMSRQAILRNIQSFLLRLLVHLIKNQVEQRLTNSWANSISDSIRQIKKLNLQDKTSYYLKIDEWEEMLEDEFEAAIDAASVEVRDGIYTPFELLEIVDKNQIMMTAQKLLDLTYDPSAKTLPSVIKEHLAQLPGGENWQYGRQR